jgi:CRISPR/Cas system CSM-associated protein Csm3 (group 7 of RAMP superfamily)
MKTEIDIYLSLDSPLSVGSGAMADAVADKPTLKNGIQIPIIPGSSLRGRTRHACEQIVRALYGPRWNWPECAPPRSFCAEDSKCPVCGLFGTPAGTGQVRFSDLTLTLALGLPDVPASAWAGAAARTEIRSGVGLNRARRTAQDDLLFSVETHRPGVALAYHGRVRGNVAARRDAALLVAGLLSMRALGGGKGRGLGWAHAKLDIKLDDATVSTAELVKEVVAWLY